MLSATLKESVTIEGNGLFSGEPCSLVLSPASEGSGIVFSKGDKCFTVHPSNYADSPNCSVLSGNEVSAVVTEHLFAALWAAGIDTVRIELSGPETPNIDGSAKPLYDEIVKGGKVEYGERPRLWLSGGIKLEVPKQATLEFEPMDYGLALAFAFIHPDLGRQDLITEISREWAVENILPARTFITEAEAKQARELGILRHSDETAALLIRRGMPNQPLRFEDEYVRHKVLDLLGDLYALPFEVTGNIVAARSGHALNRALAKELAARMAGQN